MGCIAIAACFGCSTEHGKTKKHRTKTRGKDLQSLSDPDAIKEALLCVNQTAEEAQIADSVIKEKNEDKLNESSRKKVTFDLNVKSPEECQVQEEEEQEEAAATAKFLAENNGGGKREEESKDEVGQDQINCSNEKGEEKAKKEQSEVVEADLVSESSASSLFTYPLNFRYQNCESSDDDSVDMDLNGEIDSNYKDKNGCDCDDRDAVLVQEESSESLFSLSIDSRKQNSSAVEIDAGEKEVCSPLNLKPPGETREMSDRNARERSNYVQSVLNPIENLSQWKAVRTKTISPLTHQEKENIHSDLKLEQEDTTFAFSEEPGFKKSPQKRLRRSSEDDGEITVDTSLSSWLMGSGKAPTTSENSPGSEANSFPWPKPRNTPTSLEDRPILGALTVEELKEMTKTASPSPRRRSPSHSPDEKPIIGTVGSYWSHATEAIGAADFGSSSMSRFGIKGSINSTPFQTRLERAQGGS